MTSPPSKAAPTLPAHIVHPPSTPTNPKKRHRETQRQLQTPRHAKRPCHDNPFSHMPSSPPIVYESDEENDWLLQETAADAAMLSSNIKPVPASPNAESTAISGHADCEHVASEKRTADVQTAKSNPFTRRPTSKKVSSFIRRLTGDEPARTASDPRPEVPHSMLAETGGSGTRKTAAVVESNHQFSQQKTHSSPCRQPLPHAADISHARGLDLSQHNLVSPISKHSAKSQIVDTVLEGSDNPDLIHNSVMGDESAEQINDAHCRDDQRDSSDVDFPPVYLRSSPPRASSPSSRSSTSAECGPSTQPTLPISQAEEKEWEANLEPHQRDLHDLLVRTSKRMMRHIVETETGLNEIAETFLSDGEHILQSLLRRHENEYKCVFTDMDSKKASLRTELEHAMKQIAEEKKRVNATV